MMALVHWTWAPQYLGYGMYEHVTSSLRSTQENRHQEGRCGNCGLPARTIDWGFLCWVCSPSCTEKMWDDYNEACGKRFSLQVTEETSLDELLEDIFKSTDF